MDDAGRADEGGSSVLLIRGSVDDGPPPRCERVRFKWVNIRTGETSPGRCGASFCEQCGPYEAKVRARIISDGGRTGPPQRYFVHSLPPEQWNMEWARLRQKMRDYKRIMHKRHGEYEQAWTVERGKKRGMLHVNVLQKGTYIDQDEAQRTWGGIVHAKAIKGARGVSSYALKEALTVTGYSLKEAGESLAAHLDLNGGRLVHLSRGYLGGDTMADVRARLTRNPEAEPGEWVRVFDLVA